MNKQARSILRQLRYAFPPPKYSIVQEGEYLIVEKPFEKKGGIECPLIHIAEDRGIWLREPFFAYGPDTIAKLLSIMKGVFADEILWVIGSKEELW